MTRKLIVFVVLLATIAGAVFAESPKLKANSRVVLTLEDGRQVTAKVFMGADGCPHLLFAFGSDVEGFTLIPEGNPPPIPPEPGPGPNPAPTGTVAWIIVIDSVEANDRTIGQDKVLSDNAFWTGLKREGLGYLRYSRNDPDVARFGYDKALGDIKPPAILLLDKSGKKLKALVLPESTAAIQALLKEGK